MYIADKLVESCPLSIYKINNFKEREWYIQGAINELMEKWEDVLHDAEVKPEFYLREQMFNSTNQNFFR